MLQELDTFLKCFLESTIPPVIVHFCYLYNKVKIITNNRIIIKNKNISLFVIIPPPSYLRRNALTPIKYIVLYSIIFFIIFIFFSYYKFRQKLKINFLINLYFLSIILNKLLYFTFFYQ